MMSRPGCYVTTAQGDHLEITDSFASVVKAIDDADESTTMIGLIDHFTGKRIVLRLDTIVSVREGGF